MDQRITLITVGVADLERSLRFYRDGLGLPTRGIVGTEFEHGAVAFIDLGAMKEIRRFDTKPLGRKTATIRSHEYAVPTSRMALQPLT